MGVSVASAVIIVPARLASTRLPGKVLLARTGMPLVQHVVERARVARCCGRVVVAADDHAIATALEPFGTRVVLTSPTHANGTSRLAEAATLLGLGPDEIVVNVQGDEPEIEPATIDAAAAALVNTPGSVVGTVACAIASDADFANPNVVKVVRRLDGAALYFSRAQIPHDRDARRDPASVPMRHIGVYAYRVEFLQRYARMAMTPLERSEQLEQLRVLEHGLTIGVGVCEASEPGVDTPEQYEAFVKRRRERSST